MEEKELCRRSTIWALKKSLKPAVFCLVLSILGIVVNIVIRIIMAKNYGPYAASIFSAPYIGGWATFLLFGIIAIILFVRNKNTGKKEMIIILTNKRIITSVSVSDGKNQSHYSEESFMLNKIVSFSKDNSAEGKGLILTFTTINKTYAFDNLDDEFYNLFLTAI